MIHAHDVEAITVSIRPPLCPEITLRLARRDTWAHEFWRLRGRSAMGAPFWGICWASGQGLARYLLDNPQLVRGKRVVDFGSGSGIGAIAAALAGAASVIATDTDPWSRAAIALNSQMNHVAVHSISRDILSEPLVATDVLLMSDVFYSVRNRIHSVSWLPRLTGAGVHVVIADPQRRSLPILPLEKLACFNAQSLPLDNPFERVFINSVTSNIRRTSRQPRMNNG